MAGRRRHVQQRPDRSEQVYQVRCALLEARLSLGSGVWDGDGKNEREGDGKNGLAFSMCCADGSRRLSALGHLFHPGPDGRQERRMADVWRRSRKHALLPARSDQRRQFQSNSKLPGGSRPTPSARGRNINFEATPLMVHGRLYSPPDRGAPRSALDAATGELLWMHSENEGDRGANAPRQLSGHGLAYWTDGKEERILYVTPGYRLIALDAKTGVPVPSFGKNGIVDLKQDDDQEIDLVTGEVGLHSTPIVAKNVVIVGAAHLSGGVPRARSNVKGYVRGFDVQTGKRLWIFHTIPKPGEFGIESWMNDSWSYTGNTGVWGQISVDEQLGLVYLPVELPTGDYYGGHRPGNGLFGESWSRWICRPANANGTISLSTTDCGTWTFRARRSLWISR